MSAEIVAVLVIPAEGDPGGLLAEGACQAWPPRVGSSAAHDYGSWKAGAKEWTPMGWDEQGAYDTEALPLWWDGALVPEGWDRARRSMYRAVSKLDGESEPWCLLDPGLSDVLWAAARLAAGQRLASRVVRLARVDGRLVEVT